MPDIGGLLREARVALKKAKRVNYYALLEVDVAASEADIKKARLRMRCSDKLIGWQLTFHGCFLPCLKPQSSPGSLTRSAQRECVSGVVVFLLRP